VAFATRFGRPPDVVASAPGRVNLIGEHTDYNDGFVLPTAIPQRTWVALARRTDGAAHVGSDAVAGPPRRFTPGGERRARDWLDYVQGCTHALGGAAPVAGFDAWIVSDVPPGSGLSSSAALEVAVLRALRDAFALRLDDVALALTAHRAEHDFVGARVGIMDQMAASLADERSALFLDTRSRAWEPVPLPPDLGLVVVDSGIAHEHAGGEYNVRRAECEAACAALGVASLRDVGAVDLPRAAALPPPLGRRVRHVVTENARVLAAVDALRDDDLRSLGTLLVTGHASLRDDYAVSVPDVDVLVDVACADPAVYGARVTGGGFGGAVVAAARAGATADAAARIVTAYVARTGRPGRALVPAA
jgi:galactokinase